MYTQILPKLPTNCKCFKAVAGKANWYFDFSKAEVIAQL